MEKNLHIKNLKWFLMFLVIFGHMLLPISYKNSGLSYMINSFIYFFHMPVFLFLLGYISDDKKHPENLKRNFSLFLVFNLIYMIFDYFYFGNDFNFTNPYYSLWFILSILIYRIIITYFNHKLLIPVSILLSITSGFVNLDNTLGISRTITFFVFFVLGYYSKNLILKYKDKKILNFSLFLTSISLIVLSLYFFKPSMELLTILPYQNKEDLIIRIAMIISGTLLGFSLINLFPRKKRIFYFVNNDISYTYFYHRIITLILCSVFFTDKKHVLYSFICAVLIIFILNIRPIYKKIVKLSKFLYEKTIFIVSILLIFVFTINMAISSTEIKQYPVLKESDFDNTIKFSFIGDLIMLEDEVNNDYSDLFKYTKDDLGDYVISSLEGLVSNNPYSIGNYYDKKEIKLNYPISYLEEINKNVDFLSIATNHSMDYGKDGFLETIDNLNTLNMSYSGLNNEKLNDYSIIDIDGLKVALIAYSYGTNYENQDNLVKILNEDEILEDIEKIEKENVDLKIVVCHMGEEFTHYTDYEQSYWNQFLEKVGFDVILSNHSHSTKEIDYINDTLIINSPGNYVNTYTVDDGDISAICNFYVDKNTGKILTASFVPMIIKKEPGKLSVPIPSYKVDDINSYNICSKTMIQMEFDNMYDEIFFNQLGYLVKESEKVSADILYNYINEQPVVFIGDSITKGTFNSGLGWNSALDLKNKTYNLSINSGTTLDLLDYLEKNPIIEDNYIIALGINDIRYGVSIDDYIHNIKEITDILGHNKNYIFITPWYFTSSDLNTEFSNEEIKELINDYSFKLKEFCTINNYTYINPNIYLEDFFNNNKNSIYMIDGVHPNIKGNVIYSKAVINGEIY